MPYLIEAMLMVEEGVPIGQIDRAAVEFGMPMGPIALSDTVGLDICLSVAELLSGPLGISVPEGLRAMVARGELGKKSGKGFYTYDAKGQAQAPPAGRSATGGLVAERLVLRILNESAACLREGVVADADAIDAGMVYGTGFAPFLGGPMRYAEALGENGVAQNLQRLAHEYGQRFQPDAAWSHNNLFERRIPARA
jgi:3-hydroxyacyl-CoA dehydrogenase/enoyl-CoA hydratase/3-hydroxybutyryl-CoA epimerase